MRMRAIFPLFLLVVSPSVAFGQGGVPASPIIVLDSTGHPRGGVSVTICSSAGSGIPCTPLASIFTDAGLTTPATNPTLTDANGNLPVIYAAPGVYKYTVTGTGITTTGQPFTATVAGNGTLLLPLSLSQGGFTHTLTAATTAPRTWTLQDASDVFVFRGTTDTLTNKTLTSPTITNPSTTGTDSGTETLQNKTLAGASSGNTVTLVCSSGPAAAITGNGSAQNIFSCAIPANTVANLKGLRVTSVWSHSTGTATVTYGMTLNGVALWPSNNTAATVGSLGQNANIIETGSTTGQGSTPQGFFSFTATSLTGLAWTSSQTLAVTFSVANTDQITPLFFLVELIQ